MCKMLKQGTRIFYFIQAALDKVQDKAPDPSTNDQEAKARYSASVEERETVGCFLETQVRGLVPRKTIYPVVERRVWGSPTQSTSE